MCTSGRCHAPGQGPAAEGEARAVDNLAGRLFQTVWEDEAAVVAVVAVDRLLAVVSWDRIANHLHIALNSGSQRGELANTIFAILRHPKQGPMYNHSIQIRTD